jgi:cell shape-determining protein MreC
VKWLALGVLGAVAAGFAASPRVAPGTAVTRAGFLGLPTELMPERDAAREALSSTECDYHSAMIDYAARVRWRQLRAAQRQLEAEGYVCVPARVIQVEMTEERQRVRVACGWQQGIRPGTIAVAFRGLVGIVNEVGPFVSEVVLLTDPQAGVPVIACPPGAEVKEPPVSGRAEAPGNNERPTGDDEDATQDEKAAESEPGPSVARGAVVGSSSPGVLVLKYLDGAVVPGSEVRTSGEGVLYPAGLRVGQVIGHPTEGERGQPASALVSTYVDWPSVREVILARRTGVQTGERP